MQSATVRKFTRKQRGKTKMAVVNRSTTEVWVNAGEPVAFCFQPGQIHDEERACVMFFEARKARAIVNSRPHDLELFSEGDGEYLLDKAIEMGSFEAAYEALMPNRRLRGPSSISKENIVRSRLIAALKRKGIHEDDLPPSLTNPELRAYLRHPETLVKIQRIQRPGASGVRTIQPLAVEAREADDDVTETVGRHLASLKPSKPALPVDPERAEVEALRARIDAAGGTWEPAAKAPRLRKDLATLEALGKVPTRVVEQLDAGDSGIPDENA